MLTLNLAMNGLGLLFGAALHVERSRGSGTGKALALPTAKELSADLNAKNLPLDEQAAQQWLDLESRSRQYDAESRAASFDAKAGKLSPEKFEQWRKKGLALADELIQKMPRLAKLVGADMNPADIEAALRAMRGRLEALTYGGSVLLLPQYTSGLSQVGESTSWTYDPANPPKRLPELIKALEGRGAKVR